MDIPKTNKELYTYTPLIRKIYRYEKSLVVDITLEDGTVWAYDHDTLQEQLGFVEDLIEEIQRRA